MRPASDTWKWLERKCAPPELGVSDREPEKEDPKLSDLNLANLINTRARGPTMFNMNEEERKDRAALKKPSPGPITPKKKKKKKKPQNHHKLKAEERMQVWHGNESRHILDFFASKDWIEQQNMTTSHEHLTGDLNFPKLKEGHELKPWQEIGAKKLAASCNFLLGGLILGDDTGLGKSLTALVAALHQRNKMLPDCGPVAVVTRPACILQWWEEIEQHFSEETRPKAVIIDDANTEVAEILEYDVVIFANSFIGKRFTDLTTLNLWLQTVKSDGIGAARKLFPKLNPKKLNMSTSTDLYHLRNRLFPVLIIDEAHDAKNPESQYHQAIRQIPCHNMFLLTATPIFNTWHDIRGILLLFPGSPFRSIDDFHRVFALAPLHGKVGRGGPAGPFLILLRHLLSGVVVARPKSVTDLPPIHQNHLTVTDTLPKVVDMLILDQATRAQSIIWGNGALSSHNPGRDSQLKRGVRLLRTSQQMANNETLFSHEAYEEGKEKRAERYSNFEKGLQLSIHQWLKEGDATYEPVAVSPEELTPQQYSDFKGWYIHQSHLTETEDAALEHSEHTECKKGSKQVRIDSLRATRKAPANELKTIEQSVYADEDFDYDEDQEDPDFDPENPDCDTDTESRNTESDPPKLDRKQSTAQMRQIWGQTLKKMSTDELASPKVKKITEIITTIRSHYPTEKIIITATSVRFLDIIGEHLLRCLPTLTMVHFNGQIKDVDVRMDIAKWFNSGGIDLIILSAACGGTGLNLHGGSHVVIAEQFWTPGLEKQVIGCAARMPQKKDVHVYYLHMSSKVDDLIANLLARKKTMEHPLESAFRRGDNAPYVQDRLPTRYDLGFKLRGYNEEWNMLKALKEGKKGGKKGGDPMDSDSADDAMKPDDDGMESDDGDGMDLESEASEDKVDDNSDDELVAISKKRRKVWYKFH
ncbi:hypothetical protein FVEN_g3338 [Fusarium venenatum]|uniref:Helicase C-terminal domain-containing protein n=1 Tax=Fusarium venenatum TaxID=56646 RepID=A0A2L2TU16_9HYPO|nr:uncharacterized protein FVRRES_01352 [Fusarium venenatum]KAG8359134.1 hypothetical protein FVEN_g3338 [Fusarium venenatum]CEI64840.1 unnamed protein product [Fusarium venenatum]